MTRVECQQEEDWALLLVQLHNYNTGCDTNVLVEKVGGDAMTLRPPEDPALLLLIGVDTVTGMPQLTFSCETLKVSASLRVWCCGSVRCAREQCAFLCHNCIRLHGDPAGADLTVQAVYALHGRHSSRWRLQLHPVCAAAVTTPRTVEHVRDVQAVTTLSAGP